MALRRRDLMVKVKIDGESKHDRFIRLATARTQSAIKKIRVLGNCANNDSYEYSDAEASKIIRALEDEIKALKVLPLLRLLNHFA